MFIQSLLVLLGFALLLWSADLLVRGATKIATRFGISTLIIGLTVVAFGTSAPELFVSLIAALGDSSEVAIGNVVGSNLFNILMILGIAALLHPITFSRAIGMRELPIMVAAMVVFWITAASQFRITAIEGAILFLGIVGYLLMSYVLVRRSKTDAILTEFDVEHQPEAEEISLASNAALVIVGLVGLIFGSELIVENATAIARSFGVSDYIIGISLVAIGTSLPELATTAVAALKSEPDLAIGNAVGSNIFNVFVVIGLTSIVSPLPVERAVVEFDFAFMIAVCLVVWGVALGLKKAGRVTGLVFVGLYVGYIAAVIS